MRTIRLFTLLATFALTACSFEVSVGPTSTSVPTTVVEPPTSTAAVVPSPTEVIDPTATIDVPTPTLVLPTPTLVPTQPTEQNVNIFLIALEDKGRSGTQVGCGDSAVPITVTIPKTQGVLRAVLEKLFSAKKQFYGELGLYNALYQSDLQVSGVTIEQGKAVIHLTGTILLGGTCDAPRVQAQIEQTARQFSTVNEIAVFVNDVPLEEVLSSK